MKRARFPSPRIALLAIACMPAFAATPCPECEVTPDAAGPAKEVASEFRSAWLPMEERTQALRAGRTMTNQEGEDVDLVKLGKPVVLSFVYTRCQNTRKCPRVSREMAELAALAGSRGIAGEVRFGLVTYDPEFDVPAVMKSYGEAMKLPFGEGFMMLRPAPDAKAELFEELGVRVNYDRDGEVNVHANQLLVIDASGRLARRYEVLLWNNEDVLEDLAKLLAEPAVAEKSGAFDR